MSIKQQLSLSRDHISFISISSNESATSLDGASSDYESAKSSDDASSDYESATSLDAASSNYESATSFENQNNNQDIGQIEENIQRTTGSVYTPLIMNHDEQIDEDNQATAGPLLTPPETPSESIGQESSGCCDFLNSVKLYFCDHHTFSKLDFLLTLVSIGTFLFDVLSDLTLAATYYTKIEDNEIYGVYFRLTLGFVIIPSVFIQLFSLAFHMDKKECSKSKHLLIFVIHFFQLSVLYRYICVIYYGIKSRYYKFVLKEECLIQLNRSYEEEVKFITISRLFESFMESTPQLVLQIYIVLMTKQFPLFTVISCAGSLLALSTTMFSTQRYFRAKKTQTQLSIPASFVIFCWRACTILSRVLVFGLFLTVRPHLFLVGIILHWVVATVLVTKESTGKWISGVTDMLSYGILYGIILIFCFIDTGVLQPIMEIKPRLKMFIFYAVVVIENVGVSYWWYLTQLRSHTGFLLGNLSSTFSNKTSTSLLFGNLSSTLSNETIVENELFPTESAGIFERRHAFIILVTVHGLFLLGMLFMIVYYQVLHPIKV